MDPGKSKYHRFTLEIDTVFMDRKDLQSPVQSSHPDFSTGKRFSGVIDLIIETPGLLQQSPHQRTPILFRSPDRTDPAQQWIFCRKTFLFLLGKQLPEKTVLGSSQNQHFLFLLRNYRILFLYIPGLNFLPDRGDGFPGHCFFHTGTLHRSLYGRDLLCFHLFHRFLPGLFFLSPVSKSEPEHEAVTMCHGFIFL